MVTTTRGKLNSNEFVGDEKVDVDEEGWSRRVVVADAPFDPLGHQTVTVTPVAASLAALLAGGALPQGTKLVYLQPRGDGIRYAHGGATPTNAADASGIGIDLFAGAQYPLRMSDFATLKLIAASTTLLAVEFRG